MSVLLVERPEPGLAVLTLNRPDKLNALSAELMAAIERELSEADADPDCRAIVVTGAGRGFCSGLDLDDGFAAAELEANGSVVGGMEAQERVARSLTTPRRLRTPVIAAVNGAAAGGGLALALAADVRLAATSARFNVAFVRVGLSGCDCGVSYLLPRAIGTGLAFELMLTGRQMDAVEAERTGLVSRVLEPEELLGEALAVGRQIAENAPFGVEMTKQVMWASLAIPSLDEAIELENRTQILSLLTEDQPRAVAALRERRRPDFRRK